MLAFTFGIYKATTFVRDNKKKKVTERSVGHQNDQELSSHEYTQLILWKSEWSHSGERDMIQEVYLLFFDARLIILSSI